MIHRAGSAIACALAAAALYGLIPNFSRAAFESGVPPVESTFFRTSVIAIAFAVLTILRGENFALPRAALGSFASQALATLVISVGYLAAGQFIPVGLAVIIFFSFPLIILLASPLIEGRKPGLLRFGISLFAFAGLAVAVGPSFEGLDPRGLALASAAAAGAVLQFFSGRAISHHLTPTVFGSLVHFAIWPATLLVALTVSGGTLQILPGGTATAPGYTFLLALAGLYAAAYLVQMLSLRFAPASTVAPFFNLEPVVTTGGAALLLGERLALNQYAGGGMVLAALLASSLIEDKAGNP
ncbi:MAG: DMT family transporter [Hyphomicrobiales bacterium]